VQLEGYTIFAYDYPTLIALYRDIFLKQVYHVTSNNDTPLMIDCGANIGMSVLFFKRHFPNATIWAIEPNPTAFKLLQKNMLVNQITGVTLFECALADVEGTIDFYIPAQKGSLNGSVNATYVPGILSQVAAKRLSDLIGNRHVDVVKMDIEGAENSVAKDLYEHNILGNIDQCMLEYHHLAMEQTAYDLFVSYFVACKFDYKILAREKGFEGGENIIMHFKK
jgi:FkbM family methyltransferase